MTGVQTCALPICALLIGGEGLSDRSLEGSAGDEYGAEWAKRIGRSRGRRSQHRSYRLGRLVTRVRGLHCLTWLGHVPNLPAQAGSANEQLLVKIVNALKNHPALAAWKGVDEPALAAIPVAGLVRAYQRLRALDPAHPLVIDEAPLGTVAALAPYSAALDIAGADIYPVSYPPGIHEIGRAHV